MYNFFVTKDGETIFDNINRSIAVKKAKQTAIENNGGNIGIGRYKYRKGVRIYTLLPWTFFIDE